MYKFITAASLLASGAMANMMPADTPAPVMYGNNNNYGAASSTDAAPVMYSAPAMTEATTPMMDQSSSTTTTTVMMNEQTSMASPAGYNMYAPPPMMDSSSSMMEGEVSSSMMAYTPPSMTEAPTMEATMAPPSYAAAAMTHTVIVGGAAGLEYTPPSVMASVGDIIMFQFMKQNHSVTQSTFMKPCIKMAGGLDSGLMPNPNNTVVPAPTFMFTVKSMDPTWWYCKQKTGTHCGKGMVFAVNPTMEKSYSAFQSMAIAQNGTAATATSMPAAGGYMPPSEATMAASSTVTLIGGGDSSTMMDSSSTMMDSSSTMMDSTSTMMESAPAASTDAAAPPAIATGTNSGSGDSCSCSCFCGVGAYPAGWGVGNMGGMGGVLPAPWASSMSAAAPAATMAGGYKA